MSQVKDVLNSSFGGGFLCLFLLARRRGAETATKRNQSLTYSAHISSPTGALRVLCAQPPSLPSSRIRSVTSSPQVTDTKERRRGKADAQHGKRVREEG